jgi:hypothetical protein
MGPLERREGNGRWAMTGSTSQDVRIFVIVGASLAGEGGGDVARGGLRRTGGPRRGGARAPCERPPLAKGYLLGSQERDRAMVDQVEGVGALLRRPALALDLLASQDRRPAEPLPSNSRGRQPVPSPLHDLFPDGLGSAEHQPVDVGLQAMPKGGAAALHAMPLASSYRGSDDGPLS